MLIHRFYALQRRLARGMNEACHKYDYFLAMCRSSSCRVIDGSNAQKGAWGVHRKRPLLAIMHVGVKC